MTYLITTDEAINSGWSIANRWTDWLMSPVLAQPCCTPSARERLSKSMHENGLAIDLEFDRDPEVARQIVSALRSGMQLILARTDIDETTKLHIEKLVDLLDRWDQSQAIA